jgi:hypothetical protein
VTATTENSTVPPGGGSGPGRQTAGSGCSVGSGASPLSFVPLGAVFLLLLGRPRSRRPPPAAAATGAGLDRRAPAYLRGCSGVADCGPSTPPTPAPPRRGASA